MATQAFAGPRDDARAYVESTKEGARAKARTLFHEYLQGAALKAAKVSEHSDKLNQLSLNLKDQIEKLNKLNLRLAQAVERSDINLGSQNVDNVTKIVRESFESVSELYVAAQAAQKKRDRIILEGGQVHHEIQNSFKLFLDNINETCSQGIAANFAFPDLPAIRPILPSYSFGVTVTVDSNGNTSTTPQIPNVQTNQLNGDAASMVYTGAYLGGYVLGAYLLTGKVVLTSAAAQSLTAAQALGASGIGLGVAAAVALAVYFDGLFSAISKSREVSDALWIVHNDKADAETVRAEFKAICQPFAERISKVKNRLVAIENNDAKALEELKADREIVRVEQTKLLDLQRVLDLKLTEIRNEVNNDPELKKLDDRQKQEAIMNRVQSLRTYADMQDYIKNSKSEFLMKMFEVALIDLGLHIVKVEEMMTVQYQELFKEESDRYLKKITDLAKLGRRLAIPQTVKELVDAEISANKRIASLFTQFDMNFAGYVQMQLSLGYDNSYKPRLMAWLNEVKKAQRELPSSETLKVLVVRGQSMLDFIGAK